MHGANKTAQLVSLPASQQVGQVAPMGIVLFDQLNLPVAAPVLELLFARDRLVRGWVVFGVDQAVYRVLLDELRALAAAMLFETGAKIIGHADVERSVASAGEDVDGVVAFFAHGLAA